MPTVAVKISDTITYERTAIVFVDVPDADNFDAASEEALALVDTANVNWSEEQIDNTPYETEQVEGEEEILDLLEALKNGPDGSSQMDSDEGRRLVASLVAAGVSEDEIRRYLEAHARS